MPDWTTRHNDDGAETTAALVEALEPVADDGDDAVDLEAAVEVDAFGRAMAPEWVADAEPEDLTRVLEAVCFSLNRAVTVVEAAAILGCSSAVAARTVDALTTELRERGLMVQRHQDEFQLVTRPQTAWAVHRALNPERPGRLSKAALETLAIVAYRQPVTRATLEGIRGVNCDAVIESLERRGLVEQVGFQETPGHPRTFGTTLRFLQIVGLERIEDLPPLPAGVSVPEFDDSVWQGLPEGDEFEVTDSDSDADFGATESVVAPSDAAPTYASDEMAEDEVEIIAEDDAVAVVHHDDQPLP